MIHSTPSTPTWSWGRTYARKYHEHWTYTARSKWTITTWAAISMALHHNLAALSWQYLATLSSLFSLDTLRRRNFTCNLRYDRINPRRIHSRPHLSSILSLSPQPVLKLLNFIRHVWYADSDLISDRKKQKMANETLRSKRCAIVSLHVVVWSRQRRVPASQNFFLSPFRSPTVAWLRWIGGWGRGHFAFGDARAAAFSDKKAKRLYRHHAWATWHGTVI